MMSNYTDALTTTSVKPNQGSKLVFGLMGVTVLFSLLGAEIHAATNPPKGTNAAADALGSGAKVMAGGSAATVILVLMTHAGDAGRQFAVGLALVTMATATLVYGAPVWDAMSNAFGSTPTGKTGATAPTTPGSNTGQSAAIVATNLA